MPGVPKWSVLQPYFRWAGIDGVTNPFVPEVVVNHDLLPMEWPFTVAHEWGHLAGLAHEAEASYAGWLTVRPAPTRRGTARRCGRSGTSSRRARASSSSCCRAAWATVHAPICAPLPMRTSQRVRVVQRVSWATYDRYLKSNRVSEGLASYDAAIVLILAGLPESRHDKR